MTYDSDPNSKSEKLKAVKTSEAEYTCHGCGASGGSFDAVFSQGLCKQCGKVGKEMTAEPKIEAKKIQSGLVFICSSDSQALAEAISKQFEAEGLTVTLWTELITNGMSRDQIATTAWHLSQAAGGTFVFISPELSTDSVVAKAAMDINNSYDGVKPAMYFISPEVDASGVAAKLLTHDVLILADDTKVTEFYTRGIDGQVASLDKMLKAWVPHFKKTHPVKK